MNKQPEITERTKQTFADAFCELFCQFPIERITIQELTKQTGHNRSTFYHYFHDIYELRDYVEDDLFNYIKRTLGNTENSTEYLKPEYLIRFFTEKETYLSAVLGGYGSAHFIERFKSEISLEEQLEEQSGLLSKDIPLFSYFMEFHISTTFSLFRLWLQRNKDLSVEQLSNLIYNLYTNGISARPE